MRRIGKARDIDCESVGLIEVDPCAFSSNAIVAVQEELAPTTSGDRAVEVEAECVSNSPVNDEVEGDQQPRGTVGIDVSPYIEQRRFVPYDNSNERLLDGREWPIDAAEFERCHERIVPGRRSPCKLTCGRRTTGPEPSAGAGVPVHGGRRRRSRALSEDRR